MLLQPSTMISYFCLIITILQFNLFDGFTYRLIRSTQRHRSRRTREHYNNNNDNDNINNNNNNNNNYYWNIRTRLNSLQKDTPFFKITSTAASATATATSLAASSSSLVEKWCITHINILYDRSLSMKCPFFRRRSTDLLEGLDMIMRFLIIQRHKSLPLITRVGATPFTKNKHLSIQEVAETIRVDWKSSSSLSTTATTVTTTTTTTESNENTTIKIIPLQRTSRTNNHKMNHKGYYITGRLNTTIYRDDCIFDGPDPDMPVRGLKKYLNAASQLFDTKASTAELISLTFCGNSDNNKYDNRNQQNNSNNNKVVARWKLQGVLHLPWHPKLPVLTGSTIYHLDNDNLIHRHEEFWDISVAQAFVITLWPEVGSLIWKEEQ